MDQAFSIKNLKALLKEDRDKGGSLEEEFIPDAYVVRKKIYDLKALRSFSRYRFRVGKITEDFYVRRVARISVVLEKRKIQRDEYINEELSLVSSELSKKEFRVNVVPLPSLVAGKRVYGIGSALSQILAVRFTQRILKNIYDVKMPSRDILVSQVRTLVLDQMPKYIIRADVESFYESVRHKDLLDSIHQSSELSVVVKRILTRLIKDYAMVSGEPNGLPRGIGLSAYLSEIYLSSIDQKIKGHEDLFFYSRYVDDMVLMYAPQRKDAAASYLMMLKETLECKGLRLNAKTKTLDLLEEQKDKFDYLGYEFDLNPSSLGVRLSSRKVEKYRTRINKSFDDFSKKKVFISRKASEELYVRMLFLTGNMRLFNRKSNAFIGVYFSNKFITDTAQLRALDYYYQSKVKRLVEPALKRKLGKLSFVDGFDKKIFRAFDARKLSEIARGWTHA